MADRSKNIMRAIVFLILAISCFAFGMINPNKNFSIATIIGIVLGLGLSLLYFKQALKK